MNAGTVFVYGTTVPYQYDAVDWMGEMSGGGALIDQVQSFVPPQEPYDTVYVLRRA
jgi:hypothetical protein